MGDKLPNSCQWDRNKFSAESRQVQDNHYAGEKVKPHRQSDPDMHRHDPDQPKQSRSLWPDQKWISRFQNPYGDAGRGDKGLPRRDHFPRQDVEGRTRESAPYAFTGPPFDSEDFR